jgi:hypothetical protein
MKYVARIVAVAFVLPAATTAYATELSYVLDYNGPAKAYSVIRAGRPIAVTPYLPLLNGDKVAVVIASNGRKEDAQNRIVLSVGQHRVDLDYNTGSYCVGDCSSSAPAASPSTAWTIVNNVVASLSGLFAGAQDDRYTDAAESMESRGGNASAPIAVPLLEASGQRIVAGSRALALEWEGGKSPFTVTLYRAGSPSVVATVNATERSAVFPAAVLSTGGYRVEIDDVAGQTGGGTFQAVAPDAVPAPTADERAVAADTTLPQDMRTTLGAAALVQRAPAFGLEAYQRVAPLASSYEPAELLRYRLAEPT